MLPGRFVFPVLKLQFHIHVCACVVAVAGKAARAQHHRFRLADHVVDARGVLPGPAAVFQLHRRVGEVAVGRGDPLRAVGAEQFLSLIHI